MLTVTEKVEVVIPTSAKIYNLSENHHKDQEGHYILRKGSICQKHNN